MPESESSEIPKMVPPETETVMDLPLVYIIVINTQNVIISFALSNLKPESTSDAIVVEVDKEIYDILESDISKKYKWINNELVEYNPPIIKSYPSISDSQFFGQLAIDKIISEEEALATSDGTMPDLLMNILNQIPDPKEKFMAIMRVKNTTVFEINNPIVEVVRQALNKIYKDEWPQARIEKLWEDASNL